VGRSNHIKSTCMIQLRKCTRALEFGIPHLSSESHENLSLKDMCKESDIMWTIATIRNRPIYVHSMMSILFRRPVQLCRTQRGSHIFRSHPAAAATPCTPSATLFMPSWKITYIMPMIWDVCCSYAHLGEVILAPTIRLTAALAAHPPITPLGLLIVPAQRALLR
jgi:hypothetical protein